MEDEIIYEDKGYLGSDKTNNFAEYQGALQALKLAKEKRVSHLTLYSDSELLIRRPGGL